MEKNLKRTRKKKTVLGSSNVEDKSQKFILQKEISTNLQSVIITVNKKRWKLVDSFQSSSQNDHHYVIQRDDNGMTFIQFGDGINGARLPQGKDNVIATYKVGTGKGGNIKNRLVKNKYSISKAKLQKE